MEADSTHHEFLIPTRSFDIFFVSHCFGSSAERFGEAVQIEKIASANLAGNLFNSSIFTPVSAVTSLRSLNLNSAFSKTLTFSELAHGFENLSRLRKLEDFAFASNLLDNSPLQLFSSLKALTTVDLSGNLLNGSTLEFPKDWIKMRVLDLSNNDISGKVPASILSLRNIEALSLVGNNLTDSLLGICELWNLRELDLSNNNFEGIIPSCLGNLTNLRMLDLSHNKLAGNIPPSLTFNNCKFLRVLELSKNQLTGDIPSSLVHNLTQLEYISFSNNLLKGKPFLNSLADGKLQLTVIGLSKCSLHMSTTDLSKSLRNQFNFKSIDFSHNNIYGKYPDWLAENNTRLEALILNNNSLSGHIHFTSHSTCILSKLDISDNNILGNLQKDFGDVLSTLVFLSLSKNSLEGEIPPSLGNITNLEWLDISNNNFSGEMPGSLGSLHILLVLVLSNNRLQGRIPSFVFNSSALSLLRFSSNNFTGFSEEGINRIHSTSIIEIDMSQNEISGWVPTWISLFTQVVSLFLADNRLDGPIPTEICKLSTIEYLDISNNNLSGSVPTCLNLHKLKFLHLQRNQLTGEVPQSLVNNMDLLTLNLRDNKLSGGIPSWLGLLRNLRVVLLGKNLLDGVIPHELCDLNNLGLLDLSHNHLSGSIPTCFKNIKFGMAEAVDRETGAIFWSKSETSNYSWIGLLVNKFFAFGEDGDFRNQEEVEFITKSRSDSYKGNFLNFMSGIDLSLNYLTGEIPQEMGALSALRALNLSYNQLTGSIPRKLSALKKIESMDLSHNKLSGEIPSELSVITTLAVFIVSYNNLSGRVLEKAQFSTFGEASYEGNPLLCGPPLQKICDKIGGDSVITRVAENFGIDPISLIASCAASYAITLLALVLVLFVNHNWRRMWFDFVDRCFIFMFPSWTKTLYKGYWTRRM